MVRMLREPVVAKFQAVGIEPFAQAAELTAPPWLKKRTAVPSLCRAVRNLLHPWLNFQPQFAFPVHHLRKTTKKVGLSPIYHRLFPISAL